MAMLAEPRRKVRYIVNPTGRDWAQEQGGQSHFGQRMLRTMGWRDGQGLGKDNQGSAEPIHVKRKSDQRGVGCSSAYAAETMPQSVDFASLLSQLNEHHGGSGDNPAGDAASDKEAAGARDSGRRLGLEAKSKSSRARLHYHKFTRGKDVSAYDSHSLACIFGSRNPQVPEATAAPTVEAAAEDAADEEASTVGLGFQQAFSGLHQSQSAACLTTDSEHQHGLQLVRSQTSLQDYFKAKMLQMRERQKEQHRMSSLEQPSMSCSGAGDDGESEEHQDKEEEDRASWTSESSCSVASSREATDTVKRVRFDIGESATAPDAVEPDSSHHPVKCGDSPDVTEPGLVVIDFGLFPGSAFHRVLGYPLY